MNTKAVLYDLVCANSDSFNGKKKSFKERTVKVWIWFLNAGPHTIHSFHEDIKSQPVFSNIKDETGTTSALTFLNLPHVYNTGLHTWKCCWNWLANESGSKCLLLKCRPDNESFSILVYKLQKSNENKVWRLLRKTKCIKVYAERWNKHLSHEFWKIS